MEQDAFQEELDAVPGESPSPPSVPPASPPVDMTWSETPSVPTPEPLTSASFNDWSKSYHGLSIQPFSKEISDVLLGPIDPMDVEMKPGKPGVQTSRLAK